MFGLVIDRTHAAHAASHSVFMFSSAAFGLSRCGGENQHGLRVNPNPEPTPLLILCLFSPPQPGWQSCAPRERRGSPMLPGVSPRVIPRINPSGVPRSFSWVHPCCLLCLSSSAWVAELRAAGKNELTLYIYMYMYMYMYIYLYIYIYMRLRCEFSFASANRDVSILGF